MFFGRPAKFPDAQDPAAAATGPLVAALDEDEEDEAEDELELEGELDDAPAGDDAEEGAVGSREAVLLEN